MSDYEVTRETVAELSQDDPEHFGLILDVLLDIRDLLTPKTIEVKDFDPAKFPHDLGPCVIEFCTEKAAYIDFERGDLGKLFVPFSRMAPGAKEACGEGVKFNEFFLGTWIYERLLDQVDEDRSGAVASTTQPFHLDDIPY